MSPLLAALVPSSSLPMLLLLLIVTPSMPTALKSPNTPLPSFAVATTSTLRLTLSAVPTETIESSRLIPVSVVPTMVQGLTR